MNNDSVKSKTQELEAYLKQTGSVDDFFEMHSSELLAEKPGPYLARLIENAQAKKKTLLKTLSISRSYFYEILNGTKLPSRSNFIQILIALSLPFVDCQKALKSCGYSPLYARNRRDAVIIYCIENKKTLVETNIILESQQMPLLY